MESTTSRDWIAVTSTPLSASDLTAWATRATCGAIVAFCGTVRNTSGARDDIASLEYETDVPLAEAALAEIVAEARRRWPAIEAVAIHHRVGTVDLRDVAVVVVVSSPHRHDAFDAAQYCIDTLKRSVPMWKRDVWPGGDAWSSDALPLQRISSPGAVDHGDDARTGATP